MVRTGILAGTVLTILFLGSQTAHAQQVQRYSPRNSTISPYLNLTRTNTGGLPNYYSLVRPLQQQQAFNTVETDLRNRQGQQLQDLRGRLDTGQVGVAPTGGAAWFMVPGKTTNFSDTRRYYPSVNLGRR